MHEPAKTPHYHRPHLPLVKARPITTHSVDSESVLSEKTLITISIEWFNQLVSVIVRDSHREDQAAPYRPSTFNRVAGNCAARLSDVPQSFDWIHCRGTAGGIEPEHDSDSD